MSGRARPILSHCLGQIPPGVPVVVCGPSGSGRTVVTFEAIADALARGERALLLTGELPRLVIEQAQSLGIELEAPLRDGRFVLLEIASDAAQTLLATSGAALRAALAEASAGTALVAIDPMTAFVSEFLEERELRALTRELFEGFADAGQASVVTCAREALDVNPLFERVLKETSGAWVTLRLEAGRRTLQVEKARRAGARSEVIAFEIGAGGTRIVESAAEPRPAAGRAEAAEPRASAAPGAEAHARKRLLIVENDRGLLAQHESWLRGRYELSTANDGYAALSALMRERPDLVLIDPNLPRVSGFEVLRALRGQGSRIPVLVVTSSPRASDRLRALVLGAADVLSKSVPRYELSHKIESVLLQAEPARLDCASEDAEALLDVDGRTRLLDATAFRERVARAQRFGREFGMESMLAFLEAESAEARDALQGAAEEALRAEDALLAFDKHRLVVLIVCCGPGNAEGVLRRFGSGVTARGAKIRDLRYAVAPVSAWPEDRELEAGFCDPRRWPEARAQ
jgi:DNA-binding response OmpR family regulator/KaiC/GvpD/RAD55 family RecA-like ATPase